MSGEIEVLLSADVARRMTDEVKADAATLWAKLVTLYEGQAHIALGYTSWGAYYAAEFGENQRRGYQLLDAGRVLDALGDCTMVQSLPATEREARELVPLLAHPDALRGAWAASQELAAERGQPVTAAIVRDAVQMVNHIRSEAAASREEMAAATANWSPQLKADMAPEMMRQRGEFRRLIRDLAAVGGGDPSGFVERHRRELDSLTVSDAHRARNWLDGFIAAVEAKG